MNDDKLIEVLKRMRKYRLELKSDKQLLVEYACDKCGYDQKTANQENLELYLSAYLQGKGVWEYNYKNPNT